MDLTMNNNEFPFNHFFSSNSDKIQSNGLDQQSTSNMISTTSNSAYEQKESSYSSGDLELLSIEIKTLN